MDAEDFIMSQSVFRVYRKIQLQTHYAAAGRRLGEITKRRK